MRVLGVLSLGGTVPPALGRDLRDVTSLLTSSQLRTSAASRDLPHTRHETRQPCLVRDSSPKCQVSSGRLASSLDRLSSPWKRSIGHHGLRNSNHVLKDRSFSSGHGLRSLRSIPGGSPPGGSFPGGSPPGGFIPGGSPLQLNSPTQPPHSRPLLRSWRSRAFDREVTWTAPLSPYELLGVDRNATTEDIKTGYRRMAKTFHPDVYSGVPELSEGETVESRFIQIQAAYEILTDRDQKQRYDMDTRTDPLKASKAWQDWVLRKKKAFEQRGDVAFSAWAEQQNRELSLRARQLSKAKMDPGEERRLFAKEKAATVEQFETTLKRHTLVLKKRDLERQKGQEAARRKLVADLLLAEGLELEMEEE